MARTKRIVSGTKATLNALDKIKNNVRSELNLALKDIANTAVDIAQAKIIASDHTQKYGDELADKVGASVKNQKATIYAPYKENTLEMRNHMYYLEYGAGFVGGTKWIYGSREEDKNPKKFRTKDGKLWGVTDYSEPVGYMRSARRYIIENASGIIKQRINFVIGRRYRKNNFEGEEE